MQPEDIERMRRSDGKIINTICSDGESLKARIVFVNSDHEDTIYYLVSTTTPEKYKQGTASAYVIK